MLLRIIKIHTSGELVDITRGKSCFYFRAAIKVKKEVVSPKKSFSTSEDDMPLVSFCFFTTCTEMLSVN